MKIEKSTPESTRFHQNHFDALCERYGNCIVSRAKFEEKMFSFEETLEKYCVQKCSDPNYNEEQHKVTEKKVRDYILSVFPEKKEQLEKELYFNHDPRGYAIKLNIEPRRDIDNRLCRDWGDFIILGEWKDTEEGWTFINT